MPPLHMPLSTYSSQAPKLWPISWAQTLPLLSR